MYVSEIMTYSVLDYFLPVDSVGKRLVAVFEAGEWNSL